MKHAAITANRSRFRLVLMCRVLGISRGGYYAACRRPASERSRQDTKLAVAIAVSHKQSRKTYGSPRVLRDLRASGERVGRKRVARLMASLGLRGTPPRRFRLTTDSRHAHPLSANVLARDFAVGRPNRVWAADITYLWTGEGWLYLAVVLDLGSRRVVGYSLGTRLDASLVRRALDQALAKRRPLHGLMHHSDRGSQYACGSYRSLLEKHGIACSMSRRGNCWDNAVVESFFSTLKRELVRRERWETRSDAARSLFSYLEGWYNSRRRHSSLGYLSPADYEAQLDRAA